ncbi:methyltransferase domain-containing protein [Halomonas saccharevitans]|uniref:Methyltransferase domain-containing protein n=1 Tax=Halomonas saccharevitans TaxID=416872 RepID=A0A1I6XVN5_9GAMM|nr:class I SAM-dependent methyltransferase [Halomonas saccharevitans]MDT8879549.1 methyltransferase domain-containing protein [Halomonas saccharevitans]SFT41864.1 Methyltransferase domain-containing protein [Halomonas saccharevitans]
MTDPVDRFAARPFIAHYDAPRAAGRQSLPARLRDAFRAAGCDPERLTLDEIAGIDQLHLGGRRASRSLAALGGLTPGQRVLDVGCGTGGASRLLAAEFGSEVTGLDITPAFVEVAAWLSRATGYAERTRFLCADAARVPLPEASMDVVWCQHALMNMPDAATVLAEWRRLLVPGGRVLLHEPVAGDNDSPLRLPVPWAREVATSHLRSREALERLLAAGGFVSETVHDVSKSALDWRRKHGRREASDAPQASCPTPPTLPGPSLIFGEAFVEMGRNLGDNLAADRVRILEGGWRKA